MVSETVRRESLLAAIKHMKAASICLKRAGQEKLSGVLANCARDMQPIVDQDDGEPSSAVIIDIETGKRIEK